MFFLALPLNLRRVLAIVLTALAGVAFIVALPATIDYVTFMKIEKSPVMGIRFDILYSIFILFVMAVAIGALWRLWRLLGRSWQDELVADGEGEP
jgi:TRAP-type C4-dicarboxylate transport system permease small subunit